MIARSFDPIAELQSAFNVLTKNWVLAAIPTVGLLICFALFAMVLVPSFGFAIFSGGFNDISTLLPVLGGALVGICIAGLISIVVMSIAHAAVVVGAKDVWDGRTPDVGSAIARALSRVADVILAAFSIAIICIAISWTIVGPLALIFLMIYVYPAIIVGGESAFAAMGTSWRIATQNAGPTFGAFIGIVVFWIAGAIVNTILHYIPIIGTIASLFLNGFIAAFTALVIVRFFDLLKVGAAGTQMVTPSSPPPPPPAV